MWTILMINLNEILITAVPPMPVDKDLKVAYKVLYEDRDSSKALKLYDDILKEYPENLTAMIYKAASLEKLYYGSSDWHNDQTLDNAKGLLDRALQVAQNRGDRSKIGLVFFRYFIHYYNNKGYEKADYYMNKCNEFGYQDDTLGMWHLQLDKKLKKVGKKSSSHVPIEQEAPSKEIQIKTQATPKDPKVNTDDVPTNATVAAPKLRTDWYQTSNAVVISLFTSNLPKTKDDVTAKVNSADKRTLEVVFNNLATASEFQYSIRLAHEVDNENIIVNLYTKKLEITLKKLHSNQWKTLEYQPGTEDTPSTPQFSSSESTAPGSSLSYPSSSKKQIDWSKIDLDEENDQEKASADEFFQNLYAGADPDTKRAMMKSFIESNGTALNTNWEDVSKKKVDPSPPEGMELKNW